PQRPAWLAQTRASATAARLHGVPRRVADSQRISHPTRRARFPGATPLPHAPGRLVPILTEQMFYRIGKKRRDSKSRWVQGGPWASPLTSAGAVLRPSEAARATAAALKSRMTVRKNFRTTGAYRRA